MKNSSSFFRALLTLSLCALLMLAGFGCGKTGKKDTNLDPDNPVTVTVWNYYNGDQLTAFDKLVAEFNATVGAEKGIVVVSDSQSDIGTLADALIASVKGETGAQEKPTLAGVYAETAYILAQDGALAPMDGYFSEGELASFVPGFVDEGRFNEKNELLLFPIIKSTEIFTANETDWAPFAESSGITLESLKTKEDLTAAAKAYYEWTDAMTPDVAEDGKALYGRDSVANYIYIGSYQLGHEMFSVKDGKLTVDLDRDTFKTLWDNYYIPFINGYFGAYAKFRSEDCKTGKILSLTSSSSSVGYLPTAVTLSDDTTHDITTFVNSDLPFQNAVNTAAVQQGASYCLLHATPAVEEGAVAFLKWFTEPQRNLGFALMSGYSPVSIEANAEDAIRAAFSGDASTPKGLNVLNSLVINASVFRNGETYAIKPFSGSKDARTILGDTLENTALTDRAAVLDSIAGGATREEAVAPYVTDAYFDAWFLALCDEVNAVVQQ